MRSLLANQRAKIAMAGFQQISKPIAIDVVPGTTFFFQLNTPGLLIFEADHPVSLSVVKQNDQSVVTSQDNVFAYGIPLDSEKCFGLSSQTQQSVKIIPIPIEEYDAETKEEEHLTLNTRFMFVSKPQFNAEIAASIEGKSGKVNQVAYGVVYYNPNGYTIGEPVFDANMDEPQSNEISFEGKVIGLNLLAQLSQKAMLQILDPVKEKIKDGKIIGKAKIQFSGKADNLINQAFEIKQGVFYIKGKNYESLYPYASLSEGNDEGDKEPSGLGGGAIAAIVIVVLIVVAGAVGFCVYWFLFRNRSDDAQITPQI